MKIVFSRISLVCLLTLGLSAAVSAAEPSALTKGELDSSVKSGLKDFGTPADCYNATPSSLNAAMSVDLCSGATSTAPADCYKATPSSLSAELSVKLCRHATSVAPATCYAQTPSSLNAEMSVDLCKADSQYCRPN